MGKALIAMVDARDIASSAAAVLTSDDHADRVYDITGPRAFTYSELAAILSEATGSTVSFVDTPPSMAQKVLVKQGTEEWYIHHLMEMAEMFRAGAGASTSNAVEALTGRQPRSIESFAAEHAPAFSQAGRPRAVAAVARFGIGLAARAASRSS
jgi:uncharacterized protein YbjT (DUF2867 family)